MRLLVSRKARGDQDPQTLPLFSLQPQPLGPLPPPQELLATEHLIPTGPVSDWDRWERILPIGVGRADNSARWCGKLTPASGSLGRVAQPALCQRAAWQNLLFPTAICRTGKAASKGRRREGELPNGLGEGLPPRHTPAEGLSCGS